MAFTSDCGATRTESGAYPAVVARPGVEKRRAERKGRAREGETDAVDRRVGKRVGALMSELDIIFAT